MKILLVYPKYPDTFWSFKHALGFISKKAVHPPLGLLTVASMLPDAWEKKLVDMNISYLSNKEIKWADYIFVSAMSVQIESVKEIISRCKMLGKKIVAGGPLFTTEHESFKNVDHLVLNEAEITLPLFLSDLEEGKAKHCYSSAIFPTITETAIPLWKLVNMKKYVSMNLQYSRGCPFDCEFCDITTLYGRKVRTKNTEQLLKELESLYNTGWRGGVFFVDDNFIGNKNKLKKHVLPTLIDWMKNRRYPFLFSTEASINISDDEELMRMMIKAGFDSIFIGIETPNEDSLAECNKIQNENRDLVASVQKIHKIGLQVRGGFIVGFDSDPPSVFEKQIEFIQKSRIITAMVGLLNAPRGTRLYKRIVAENRLLKETSGNNTDIITNFVPKMGSEKLATGYREIIRGIYSPAPYYERVKAFLSEYQPLEKTRYGFHFGYIRYHFGYSMAIIRSMFFLGIVDKQRKHYWKLFFWSLFKHPNLFPLAITFSIYGFHFRKVFADTL